VYGVVQTNSFDPCGDHPSLDCGCTPECWFITVHRRDIILFSPVKIRFLSAKVADQPVSTLHFIIAHDVRKGLYRQFVYQHGHVRIHLATLPRARHCQWSSTGPNFFLVNYPNSTLWRHFEMNTMLIPPFASPYRKDFQRLPFWFGDVCFERLS
jgi:hypothetical protein